MSFRKYAQVSILFLVLTKSLWGQSEPNLEDFTKIIDVLPPAPNTAALGKYGGLTFNLSTGAINTTVPVMEYTSRSLKVPISLGYNSNGFRVDEIGSNTGMSWVLNAGGVISRTIYGGPDVETERLVPPVDYPDRTRDFVDFMDDLTQSNEEGDFDGQPDIFAFNFCGYTGKFILDDNLEPVLLDYSNLKIEKDFNSTEWNFKITAQDGIQYFFGGESATEYTSRMTGGSNCGKSYASYSPTAYYLIRIVHPNNDYINFEYEANGINYKTGISETMFHKLSNFNTCSQNGQCPNLQNSSCLSWFRTNGVSLSTISSGSGSILTFNYTEREDVNNGQLLTSIEEYQPVDGDDPILRKYYNFEYTTSEASSFSNDYTDESLETRYFLTAFSEESADHTLIKKYQFEYNSLDELPPRLSYAQDHYGFFNGQDNSTLLPEPSLLTVQSYFPYATANREPDPEYGQKGLLSKIIYPTGGEDDIEYEGNSIYKNVLSYENTSSTDIYTSANSDEDDGISYSSNTTTIGFTQQAMLYGSCTATGEDQIHNQATISIIDVTNSDAVVFSQKLLKDETLNEIIQLYEDHTYKIKIWANSVMFVVTGAASLYYISGTPTFEYQNVISGGVRVKSVTTKNNTDDKVSVKKYFYSQLSSLENSSGISIYNPIYEKILTPKSMCDPMGGEGEIILCTFNTCSTYSLYSNTQNTLNGFSNSPVSYQYVVESFGENFENGGIEHQYTVAADMPGNNVIGANILGAPLTSYAFENGREIYQYAFNSNLTPVKEVFTHYTEDTRIDHEYKAYIATKINNVFCQDDPPSDDEVQSYDLMEYSHFQKWVYVDNITTRTYDLKGNYAEQVVETEYENPDHALPTRLTTYTSDGFPKTVVNYYPDDLSLSGDAEDAREALLERHIISPVLQQDVSKDNNLLYSITTDYFVFPNDLVLPWKYSVQMLGNSPETRVQFNQYDDNGNLLEQQKTNDAKNSYIWDYKSAYPIAKTVNAAVSDIAYTSFEADGTGNFSFSGSIIQGDDPPDNPPTGHKYYSLGTGAIEKSGLDDAKTYIVSYWSKNGSYTVSGSTSTKEGKTIGDWTYYEHTATGVTDIEVSGSGYIDELRLYPANAQMVTYTYQPLVGMSSQCDLNNRITYYEYDGLGRLRLIRDQDKNILKKICYNYAGQEVNCEPNP